MERERERERERESEEREREERERLIVKTDMAACWKVCRRAQIISSLISPINTWPKRPRIGPDPPMKLSERGNAADRAN